MNLGPTQHHINGGCLGIGQSWRVRGPMILRACWLVLIVSEESERPAPLEDPFWKYQEKGDGGWNWCSLLASTWIQIRTPTTKHNPIQHNTQTYIHTHTHHYHQHLEIWIQQHFKETIHDDWVGFILEMQSLFKICKSINIIHNKNKSNGKNHMIISTSSLEALQNWRGGRRCLKTEIPLLYMNGHNQWGDSGHIS